MPNPCLFFHLVTITVMAKHPASTSHNTGKGTSHGKMSVGALSSAHQKLQKENSGGFGKTGGKAGPAKAYSPPTGSQTGGK